MSPEIILCIPGPWRDRTEFLRAVLELSPVGDYLFAGGILAHAKGDDHVPLIFAPADENMARAFGIAGQGRITPETLEAIEAHRSVVFMTFPPDMITQRERLQKFAGLIRNIGGIAVKVESAGVAHEWARWQELLDGSVFDLYCAAVTLVGGDTHFYSCGMHNFGLPDCAVPKDLGLSEGADMINQFNFYCITESPKLQSGHTFGLGADAPYFRLSLEPDRAHAAESPFHNPHGVWVLEPV